MKLIEQKDKLTVENVDIQKIKKPPRHSSLLPDSIRAIIVGPSGSGKTNVMFNLITNKNGVKFENIYLYTKTPNQEKYVLLKNIINSVKGANLFIYTIANQVIKPTLVKQNSIFIFDDVICDKQTPMRDYFSMGRHSGANSIFYLAQTYSKIPKQLVRDNTNFLIIFKQDDKNLKHIFDDSCSTDMDFSEFKKMCCSCWNREDYGFIVIDKTREMNRGKYRCGFHSFIIIE